MSETGETPNLVLVKSDAPQPLWKNPIEPLEKGANEWERLKGETTRQYEAFSFYLSQPLFARTVKNAFRAAEAHYGVGKAGNLETWMRWAFENSWKERANLRDKYDLEARMREEEQTRANEREDRRKLLNAFKIKVAKYLRELDGDISNHQAMKTAATVVGEYLEQSRREYNDVPQRLENAKEDEAVGRMNEAKQNAREKLQALALKSS